MAVMIAMVMVMAVIVVIVVMVGIYNMATVSNYNDEMLTTDSTMMTPALRMITPALFSYAAAGPPKGLRCVDVGAGHVTGLCRFYILLSKSNHKT